MRAHRFKLPDRRQSLRVVTLKNAAWLFGGLLAAFLIFSAYNELVSGSATRERLSERGRAAQPAAAAKPTVVEEGAVTDETYANRGLARGSRTVSPITSVAPAAAPPAPPPPAPRKKLRTLKETRESGGKTVISGDADGLQVEQPATTTSSQ